MKRLLTCIVTVTILLISCTSNQSAEIENEILVHFSTFESEAITRGVEIDLLELHVSAFVEEIESEKVVGQCSAYSDGSKEIVFDEDYWNNSNMNEREYLVFHELGHCVLNREHRNDKDNNGNCISIMQSGENSCRKKYNSINRSELLDELFEEF